MILGRFTEYHALQYPLAFGREFCKLTFLKFGVSMLKLTCAAQLKALELVHSSKISKLAANFIYPLVMTV